MKKEVVIVIPGANYIKSRNFFIRNIARILYKFTNVKKPINKNDSRKWTKKLKSPGRKVVRLNWSGKVNPLSIRRAERKLERLLRKYSKYDVKIVAISLGGDFVLDLLRHNNIPSIKKVILIASTNKKSNLGNKDVINLYSKEDLFVRLAITVLSPFKGIQKLTGKHVTNILLNNITHDKFCSDALISGGKYKGKKISDIVKSHL
jgi:hypothetical protein